MRHSSDFRFSRRVAIAVWLAALPLAVAQDSDAPAPPPRPGLQLRSVRATRSTIRIPSRIPADSSLVFRISSRMSAAALPRIWIVAFLASGPTCSSRLRRPIPDACDTPMNAFKPATSLNIVRKLAPTWTLAVSGAADLGSVDRFMFAPTSFSSATAVPATLTASLSPCSPAGSPIRGSSRRSAAHNSPIAAASVPLRRPHAELRRASLALVLLFAASSITVRGGGMRSQRVPKTLC